MLPRTSMNPNPLPNRRTFLRRALVAGAVLSLGPSALSATSTALRLGLIGVGGRGASLLHTLLRFPGVLVPAVGDLLPDRAARAARMIQEADRGPVRSYAGSESAWEELVARTDLDAVIVATPWEWHTRMAVAAMRAGKHPGVEVPAAITLEECHELVRTSEATGIPCTMLENVCYYETALTLLRMIRQGCFGTVQHCEAGYQHDCRSLMFEPDGGLTWRGRHVAALDGNLYPTHPIGPVAQWMNINRGDRFVSLTSLSTPAEALRHFAATRFGANHPAARRDYALGDVNTTLLRTDGGRTVTLYFNLLTHRPYDLIFRLEGVRGIYLGTNDSVCLEGSEAPAHQWEPFAPYRERYAHPLWASLGPQARQSGGHDGAEYLMFHDFLKAVRTRTPAPQNVGDAATWSAVFPLSIASVAAGGRPVEFPDFTAGKWRTNPPLGVHGA